MDIALSRKKMPGNEHWEWIITRAIVFYKNDVTGKWIASIKEHKYNFN